MNTFPPAVAETTIWAGHSKNVILKPVLIDGKVNGGMWKGQCVQRV